MQTNEQEFINWIIRNNINNFINICGEIFCHIVKNFPIKSYKYYNWRNLIKSK